MSGDFVVVLAGAALCYLASAGRAVRRLPGIWVGWVRFVYGLGLDRWWRCIIHLLDGDEYAGGDGLKCRGCSCARSDLSLRLAST